MEPKYILGLDVSTTVIGICIFEDLGTDGKITMLHHIKPKIKSNNKNEDLILKAKLFEEEFLLKYNMLNFHKIIIEEPLLTSNNAYTVGTLLRFNGMITKSCFDILGIVPEFISSYDARKYAFPELYTQRKYDKHGNLLSDDKIKKEKKVLFGDYPLGCDKKLIIFNKVNEKYNNINWLFNKKNELKKENFDMVDAICCVLGYQYKNNFWKK